MGWVLRAPWCWGFLEAKTYKIWKILEHPVRFTSKNAFPRLLSPTGTATPGASDGEVVLKNTVGLMSPRAVGKGATTRMGLVDINRPRF